MGHLFRNFQQQNPTLRSYDCRRHSMGLELVSQSLLPPWCVHSRISISGVTKATPLMVIKLDKGGIVSLSSFKSKEAC